MERIREVLNDRQCTSREKRRIMLTSHKLLQQYWHDDRYDTRNVGVWYVDRGAPDDRSHASGPDISLEPYYMTIRTMEGEKPVPSHRILLITYNREVTFENRKIRGLAYRIMEEGR
jgi:uncharacterized protein (UPF0248 family)